MSAFRRIDVNRVSIEVRYPNGRGHALIERIDGGIAVTTGSADRFELDRETFLALAQWLKADDPPEDR